MRQAFFVIAAISMLSVTHAQAGLCGKETRNFIKRLVGRESPPSISSDFSIEKYFKTREELAFSQKLPELPVGSSPEMSLAWWETAIERRSGNFKKFKSAQASVDEVMKTGTETQKQKLIEWTQKYFHKPGEGGRIKEFFFHSRNFTPHEVARANLELQLILHNSSVSVKELRKVGAYASAETWIKADFADRVTRKGLIRELAKTGRMEKRDIVKATDEFLESTTGKTLLWGPANVYALSNPWTAVFFYLPDGRIAKLTQEEFKALLLMGDEALPRIAKGLKFETRAQGYWTTTHTVTGAVGMGLFIVLAGDSIRTLAVKTYDRAKAKFERWQEDQDLLEEDEKEWQKYFEEQKNKN